VIERALIEGMIVHSDSLDSDHSTRAPGRESDQPTSVRLAALPTLYATARCQHFSAACGNCVWIGAVRAHQAAANLKAHSRGLREGESKMDMLRILPLTIFCVLISVTTWAAPPTYRVIVVARHTTFAVATGLNNRGDVLGEVGEVGPVAFFFNYRSGAVNFLKFDSQAFTIANGISDSGLIVGHGATPGSVFPPNPPILWSTIGGAEELPCGPCYPNAVNNRGLIVGVERMSGGFGTAPIMWSGPQHTVALLPGLRCDSCVLSSGEARAVNSPGHIAGVSNYSYDTPPNFPSGNHAVEWQDGHVTDLGGLNGSNNSAANGINDKDDIVGMSTVGSNGFHAFLHHQGKMLDLGTLEDDTESSAASINNLGEIVGWSRSGTESRAFIYTNGRMYDLNKLIDPTSPLAEDAHIYEAVAINSTGWIAANAVRNEPGTEIFLFVEVWLLIPNAR
jgi:probable HAF family extracellular repeat protein